MTKKNLKALIKEQCNKFAEMFGRHYGYGWEGGLDDFSVDIHTDKAGVVEEIELSFSVKLIDDGESGHYEVETFCWDAEQIAQPLGKGLGLELLGTSIAPEKRKAKTGEKPLVKVYFYKCYSGIIDNDETDMKEYSASVVEEFEEGEVNKLYEDIVEWEADSNCDAIAIRIGGIG